MIRNESRGTVLAERPWLAGSLNFTCMRGMIGRRFDGFDAMVFERCGDIHMWFMSIPLDVVFIDRDSVVVGVRIDLQPWKLASQRGARTTIELPVGAIAASQTAVGDRIDLGELPRTRPAVS